MDRGGGGDWLPRSSLPSGGAVMQLELIEPRGSECAGLALQHVKKSDALTRAAAVFACRGWQALEAEYLRRAFLHQDEAETLAQYAYVLALAGVAA